MPCLDCDKKVKGGFPSQVYQPYPPGVPIVSDVCLQLADTSTVNGKMYRVYHENNDCDTVDCVDLCDQWYEYNGVVVEGAMEIDCAIADAAPPLVPGVEEICADAAGTWTSPDCATSIRIEVTQADATGPTLTVGANPPVILTVAGSPYIWEAPAGKVISPMTLTNNSLNQCSSITWLQTGTLAIPESWVEDSRTTATASSLWARINKVAISGGANVLLFPTPAGVLRYDGASWTNVLSGAETDAVIEVGGTYYATRFPDEIYSSADGIAWALFDTAPTPGNITSIAELGGDLYVGCYGSTNMYRRTAPATFSTIALPNSAGDTWGLYSFNSYIWVSNNFGGGSPTQVDRYDGAVWDSVATGLKNRTRVIEHLGDLYLTGGFPAPATMTIDALDVVTPIVTPEEIINMYSDGATLYGYAASGAVYTILPGGFTAFPVSALAPSLATHATIAIEGTTVHVGGMDGSDYATEFYSPEITGQCA